MPEVIEAEGLVLTRWRPELAPGLRAAFVESEASIREWMPSAASEQQDAEQFVAICIEAFESGVAFAYAITEARDVVAYANVRIDGGCAVLGYWVRSDRRGRGIARRAAQALSVRAGIALRPPGGVIANVDAANHPSRQVLEAAGIELIGERARVPRTDSETSVELTYRHKDDTLVVL